eukprot:TRINITY_DN14586_c0_g1_i3.p1 TRINITY_DN14586_c0_g1~~TRINITY_DN14586_c0_g1_i3.p1  ORF type:complete len:171 (-),score=20.73 TRINITY_DN14586_c0_g1_i3:266-778(-)
MMKRVAKRNKSAARKLQPPCQWPRIDLEDRSAVLHRLRDHFKAEPSELRQTPGFNEVCLGANAVARSLEQDGLRVVLTAHITPLAVLQHVLLHAAIRGIPVLPLCVSSRELGQIFGLKNLLAFGIKGRGEHIRELTQFIIDNAAVPHLPQSYNHHKLAWSRSATEPELKV